MKTGFLKSFVYTVFSGCLEKRGTGILLVTSLIFFDEKDSNIPFSFHFVD